jgi:carbamoyltransferase
MTSRIIGFNLSHDSSACLVTDGRIAAALALERTTRLKRGIVPAHAYASAMADLTHELLAALEVSPPEIDYWITTSTESRDAEDERRLARTLGLLVPAERCLTLPHPGHHLAHASAAFYTSGFDEAAALIVDAYGSRVGARRERESGFAFRLGAPPRLIWQSLRDDDRIAGQMHDGAFWLPETLSGIGELYRVITLALGFNETGTTYDDAGKTMGLAAYGEPLSKDDLFIKIGPAGLCFDGAVEALIDLGLVVRQRGCYRLVPRSSGAPLQQFHRNLAAQIQREFEEACLHLTREVLARSGSRSLVLCGGSFLNALVNARILRETAVDRLYVFPAATDDGNAAGAALYAYNVLVNGGQRQPAAARLPNVYLGPPRLADNDLRALATRWKLPVRRHSGPGELAASAAAAIARGEIVGWFQDRSEFGPRSLGARSILCHPGIAGMKDRLNARVKFRESFRPFAASVLAEHAAEWFDMPAPDSPFMLIVCPILPSRRGEVSEIVHVDGTCRVQTVDPDLPGPFRPLLAAFETRTGIPMVLNTSFNLRGMPIIERPEEAIDCLYGSRLDRLFIGDYEVEPPDLAGLRPERTGSKLPRAIRPVTGPQPVSEISAAAAGPPGPAALPEDDVLMLELAAGTLTLREIAAKLDIDESAIVDKALELRRHGLLRWAGLPQLPERTFPLPQYEPQRVSL